MIKFGVTKAHQLSDTKDFLHREKEISIPLIAALIRAERFSESVYPYFNMIRIGKTFKRTKDDRFGTLDDLAVGVIASHFGRQSILTLHDLAVSNGVTSCQLYDKLTAEGLQVRFHASDKYTHLYLVTPRGSGWTLVLDSDRNPLQHVGYGFVLGRDESGVDLVNRLLCGYLDRRRYPGARSLLQDSLPDDNDFTALVLENDRGRIERFPLVSPACLEKAAMDRDFVFTRRDLFQSFEGRVEVVRALNILNRDYFSDTQLREAIANIAASLCESGLFIVGRSHDSEDKEHNVSIFRKDGDRFSLVVDYLKGTEIKDLVLRATCAGSS